MNTFDINRVLTAANGAKLAYGSLTPAIGEWVNGVGTDVQCLVLTAPDRITFSFRGTFDRAGWMQDAKIAFTDYPKRTHVGMHAGFYEDVAAIWPKLHDIAFCSNRLMPIYVTGHSKGAGEALVFAYRLGMEFGIIAKEVITFGGPRVFNRAGSRDYEKLLIPTWRILDEDDIVCRIPWRFGLYRHVGQSAFFDGWGNMAENEPWYAHLASDIYVLIQEAKIRQNAPTADHGIDKYISRLEAWRDRMGL